MRKILLLAGFIAVLFILAACAFDGGECVLYVKVSEFTLGSGDAANLIHEYRAELIEGNALSLEYYTDEKLVCTLEKVSGGSAKLSFSAPLLSDEGQDKNGVSLRSGESVTVSVKGGSKQYVYEFSLEKVDENEAVTGMIGEYSKQMDVVEYTEQLTRVFANNFSAGDAFSDIQLLSAARYFFYEYGYDIENLVTDDGAGQITVPEENMNLIVKNLFGVERDLIECVYSMERFVKDFIRYTNKTKPYGDRYLKYDKVYRFSEDNEEWYCDYRTLMSDGHTITVNESETDVSVRMVIERYTDEESIKLGNFVIKQDVEYFYEKYVVDGFLYYRLKEVKLHGVESDPISFDDVQVLKEGSFSVRGANILISNGSSDYIYSIFVHDVTGDGENDVIALLSAGEFCVLDGYTLDTYLSRVNLSDEIALQDDGENLRVWTEDAAYSVPKRGLTLDESNSLIVKREKLSVENGKIRFDSSVIVNFSESIGDIECFFVFENGKFVQKGFSYDPIKERDVSLFAYTKDKKEKINITVHADAFWHEYSECDENKLYHDLGGDLVGLPVVEVLGAYRISKNFVFDENVYTITDGRYFEPSEECEITAGKTQSGLDYISYGEEGYYYTLNEDGEEYKVYTEDYIVYAFVRVSEKHVVLIRYIESKDNVPLIFDSIDKINFVSCERENISDNSIYSTEYTLDVSESLEGVSAIYDTYKVSFNIGIGNDWMQYGLGTNQQGFHSNSSKTPCLLIFGVYHVSSDCNLSDFVENIEGWNRIISCEKTSKGYDYVLADYSDSHCDAHMAYVFVRLSDEFVLKLLYYHDEDDAWIKESIDMISFVSAEKNEGTERPKNAPASSEVFEEYIEAVNLSKLIFYLRYNWFYDIVPNIVEIDGHKYVRVLDFDSYAEFKAKMYSTFSKEIADKYVELAIDIKNGTDDTVKMWTEHNGFLYAYNGIEGPSGIIESGENVTVVYEDDYKIRLDVKQQLYTGYISRFTECDFITISYYYELIDGEWVFTNWPEYQNEIF